MHVLSPPAALLLRQPISAEYGTSDVGDLAERMCGGVPQRQKQSSKLYPLPPCAVFPAAVEVKPSRGASYVEGDWATAAAMQAAATQGAMRLARTGDATTARQQAVFLPSWVSLLI